MSNNAQADINKLTNKARIRYLDLSNRELVGEMDLNEFKNLKSINASNNKLENLNFLNTLPNKDKIEKINCWSNVIKEIDLAEIMKNFPNLKWLNCENNPLSAKNLDNLSSEQFGKLVEGIRDKKIKINSWKGTILMDLLEYAQKLISKGNNTQNAYKLQQLIQGNSVKTEKPKNSNTTLLLVGGLVIFGTATLAIGYLWGKRKNKLKES